MTRQSRKKTPATTNGTTPTPTPTPTPATAGAQQPRVVAPPIPDAEPKPVVATAVPSTAGMPAAAALNTGGKRTTGKTGKVHDEEQQPAHLGKNKRPDLIGTRPCERYLNGHCNFGKDCWFVHEGEPRVLKPTVPAPQPPPSPEPPKPKISLAPTNPWGRVKPPAPDVSPPAHDPTANRRAESPTQHHMPTPQHGISATPPQPLARPMPAPVSAVPSGGSSPVAAPAQSGLWDSSPTRGMVGSDPRMGQMPPQNVQRTEMNQMGALGDFMRGPQGQQQQQQSVQPQAQQQPTQQQQTSQQQAQQQAQQQQAQQQAQQAQQQQQQQQQAMIHMQAQAQAQAHARAHAQQQAQAQQRAQQAQAQQRALNMQQHVQAQAQAHMQAQAAAQARQSLLAQSGGPAGGSHEGSPSLEEMRRNDGAMGLGLGYVRTDVHLGLRNGGEASPPIGSSVGIGGMRPGQGQYNYGQPAQPFGGMPGGMLGSGMSLGAAQPQQQQQPQLKPPTSQAAMSNGSALGVGGNSLGPAIGQQWGPFGGTGGQGTMQGSAALSGPMGGPMQGLGGVPQQGGPSPPGGQVLGGGDLFGMGGITDLMANARMGIYEQDTGFGGPGFQQGELWQQPQQSRMPSFPSYQGGLGGDEWQPPKGIIETGAPTFVMGDGYSLADSLEDSVPRYQQF